MLRLYRWAMASRTPQPNRETEEWESWNEVRQIARRRIWEPAWLAWDIWNAISGQITLVNPMAGVKHMRVTVSVVVFRMACSWKEIDPDHPSTEEVWEMVQMLGSAVYEDDKGGSVCTHVHPDDPMGLLTEYADGCFAGCSRLLGDD